MQYSLHSGMLFDSVIVFNILHLWLSVLDAGHAGLIVFVTERQMEQMSSLRETFSLVV